MSRRKSRTVPKSSKAVRGHPSVVVQAATAPSAKGPATVDQRIGVPALMEWLLPLLLVGIGVVAYYNSFGGAFILDDNPRIVNNPQIRQLWPPWVAMADSSRPIVQLSLALNYAIGGANPWGYHAFNLAVHVMAGLLLFGIVRRMLNSGHLRARYGAASRWLALAVAVIWLVHPLQTASVTYIIQRAESMMGLFFLLTLYCGIRACESPHHPLRWSIAAVAGCALGMGSKEVMVSAPILMWLYDQQFIARSWKETFHRRWGLYAGLAATWLLLAASLVNNRQEEQMFMQAGLTPWRYALTQFEVIVHYLRLAVWPTPLIFDYAWPLAESWLSVAPSAAVVLALLIGTVFALRKRIWAGFWGAWFFLILAPTSTILPLADVAFEHRMYLPLAAVVVIVIVGGYDGFRLAGRRLGVSDNLPVYLEAGLVVAAVLVLGYATAVRNEDYRSELAMWTDNVAKRPENARAHSNLGVALTKEGKSAEALAQYAEAVRLRPDYVIGQNNLGFALIKQGRNEEAIPHLNEAIRIRPHYADAHSNLASALAALGRNEEAVAHYSRTASLQPESAKAHNALGSALYLQRRYKEAIAEYYEAIRLMPAYPEAQHNLGLALLDSGNVEGAITHFSEAIRLKPDYAKAHNNLGTVLYAQGKFKEAIEHFSEAVRIDPAFAEARNNLQAAKSQSGAPRAER